MTAKLTKFAKVVNSLRIFPRIMICAYLYLLFETMWWYMALPDPGNGPTAVVTAVVAAGAAWFGLYVKSGGVEAVDEDQPC